MLFSLSSVSPMKPILIRLALLLLLLPVAAKTQSLQNLLNRSDSLYSSYPDSSYAIALKVAEIAETEKDSASLARALVHQARFLVLKSRFEESRETVNAAIDIATKKNNFRVLASACKIKSILMGRIGNQKEAISLNEKAATYYAACGDTAGRCNVLLNLFLDYIDLRDFKQAHSTLDTVAKYRAAMSMKANYFYHQNSGILLAAEGKHSEALVQFDQAKPIAQSRKMLDSYVTLLALIGESKMETGNLLGAEEVLLESCSLARENKLDYELNEALSLLAKVYELKGDFKKAYATTKEQTELNDRIYNLDRINKLNELDARVTITEKEKEIAIRDLDIATKQAETDRLNSQNTQLISIAISILAITILLTLLFVRTQNLNRKIEGQKKLIEEKSVLIQDAYRSITDSISYSQRIQSAILPEEGFVKSLFPESFVLYQPKDIVSGDFYWFEKRDKEFFFAAVDCTGHGVPGAFMSIVGHNLLNEAVQVHNLTQPHLILNSLNQGLSKTLRQKSESEINWNGEQVKDGMELALCSYHPETKRLRYAGAHNPVWIVRKNELIILPANKQPIGTYTGQEAQSFTSQELQLEKNDCIYLFSDGYADQFGGEKGKKFNKANLKELILKIAEQSMEQQQTALLQTHLNWRGTHEQIDDILVIGIRV
jgi:serine phosphatase RsbU (regulator of sigma subunit)